VQKGDIEGRFDTGFYKTETLKFIKWLASKSYTQKLKVFIKSMNTGFNNQQNENKNGLRFLRTQNVRPVYLDFENATFTMDKIVQISKKGTLLFTRIGVNVGDVSFNNIEDFAISDNVICADLQDETLAYYVAIFLSTKRGKILLEMQKRDTARPLISYENIRNILIPVLPTKEQTKIISIFETAYNSKKQKEAEAAELLASIDAYLLEQLGITLPPQTQKKTSFIVHSNQLSGGRFDPFYFDTKFAILRKSIEVGNYEVISVGKVCNFLSSGKTPARDEYSDEKTTFPIIKVASYSGDNIDLNKTDYANNKQPYIVEKGDIFVLSAAHQAEYVGRFVKQLDENPAIKTSFVGELICLRANPLLINSDYLFSLFSSKTFQTLLNCEKRGQTSHIYSNDIKHIQIPLPPLEKQEEIAAHINGIRARAKQLQQQAVDTLEHAKQSVEKMILGD
jgi:restriction endonuclease S subunit